MESLPEQWANGYHTNSKGEQVDLASIPDQYLQNIINKYGGDRFDTSALESELTSRNNEQD